VQRIHGLTLDASPPLPGLSAERAATRTHVVLDVVDALDPPSEPLVERYRSLGDEDDEAMLRIVDDARGLTCFRYTDGTAVDVDCSCRPVRITASRGERQTLEDLTVYLVGPVLGFVLRALDVLALHASAVIVDGEAVLLLGESGAGKSTTAAALALRGHAPLSDDLTALTFTEDTVLAQPAFDHLRLWPESETLLFGQIGTLERITPDWEKLRFDFRTPAQAVPVRAIIHLVAREHAQPCALLSTQDAILTLTAHSYSNYTLSENSRATELQQIGELVRRIPVYRLSRSAQLSPAAICDEITTLLTQASR
jgi:hypothetical protein